MAILQTTIEYSETKEFTAEQLQDLFLSVQWSSGNYPEKLQIAMRSSGTVISAWDQGKLVALMNALDDGGMTAYFHYLLVRPEYHDQGIGRELVARMLEHYKSYLRKVLIAYEGEMGFYMNCGFSVGSGKVPMFVTDLTT